MNHKSEQEPEDFHSAFQSTMLPFCGAEDHVRGYDSSRGPEVKASSGRPAATYRVLNCVWVYSMSTQQEAKEERNEYPPVPAIHDHGPLMLDETVDNFKGLSGSSPTLI
jgi:hypothetical protein